MSAQHLDTGKKGEQYAQAYLQSKGYTIRHTNWRYRHKEIDIVALKDHILHIIEVKTRSNLLLSPRSSVTLRKQRFLIQAANAYIEKYDISEEIQFDIIEVIIKNNKTFEINHIQEAFHPF